VPGAGGHDGFSALVVLGEAMFRFHLAAGAAGELRAVLALQEERLGRGFVEPFGVEVLSARDAVNVLSVVGVGVALRVLVFSLALGESFFSLSHGFALLLRPLDVF